MKKILLCTSNPLLVRSLYATLRDEGYLKDYRILKDQGRSLIKISMKYGEREKRVITRIERVSKPSRRVYVGVDEIPRVQGGVGVAILSTPRGVMTDRQARAAGVGGEVVCYVW